MNVLNYASFAVILFALVEYILESVFPYGPRFYATVFALTLLLVLNVVWEDIQAMFEKEETANWWFFTAEAILAIFSAWCGQFYNTIYIIMMIAAQVNSTTPLRPALVFTAVVTGLWFGILFLLGMSTETFISLLTGLTIGMIFVITISRVLHRLAEQTQRLNNLLEQLQAANAELVAARQREKELAIAEERVRVARDLHDGLGHHLTALSIQLQAVEKLVMTNPQMATEAAHNARSEVQAALKEVRQSVASLRDAPVDIQNLPQTIAKLVEETGKQAGLQTGFEQRGQLANLPTTIAMTLYRTVQESLTNIQKHAQAATRIFVILENNANIIRLTIQDNGEIPPETLAESAQPGIEGKFGLAGLRERAYLLGGQMTCGPLSPQGFQVELTIPIEGEPE